MLAEFQSEKIRLEKEILDMKLALKNMNQQDDLEEKLRAAREREEREVKEKAERERFEREKLEKEKLDRERLERERLERERLERERLERELREQDSRENDLSQQVQREMKQAEASVTSAHARMNKLLEKLKYTEDALWLDSSLRITNAVALLIKYAIQCQTEIIFHGRDNTLATNGPDSFYKKDSQWTDGLISAAKGIAKSMSMLCDTSEGAVAGEAIKVKFQLEQVIVVAKEVATATIHLVSASRVKAVPMSKIQPLLEDASRQVIAETKDIVGKVQLSQQHKKGISSESSLEEFRKMRLVESKEATHEEKERDMQVRILLLEQSLIQAEKVFQDFQVFFKPDLETDLFSAEAHQRNIEEMNLQIKIETFKKELLEARESLAQHRRDMYNTVNM